MDCGEEALLNPIFQFIHCSVRCCYYCFPVSKKKKSCSLVKEIHKLTKAIYLKRSFILSHGREVWFWIWLLRFEMMWFYFRDWLIFDFRKSLSLSRPQILILAREKNTSYLPMEHFRSIITLPKIVETLRQISCEPSIFFKK